MAASIIPLLIAGAGAALLGAAASQKKKPGAQVELDAHLPEANVPQVLGALAHEQSPAKLAGYADQMDTQGYHLTAAALRKKADEVPATGEAPAPAPASTAAVVPPAVMPQVTPAGIGALDPSLDPQTRGAVIQMLTSETDPARLQGFAHSIEERFPISAGLMLAKAAALIEQQRIAALDSAAAAPPPRIIAPRPAPAHAPPTRALARLSFPDAINSNQDVQHALNALGYAGADGHPLTVDGSIGPNSQFATRKFQTEHTLKVDGIPGPMTKAALAVAMHAGVLAAPASLSATSPRPGAVITNQDVQRALFTLGYPGADGHPLVIDGKIGPNSQFAVRTFQRQHALTVDGVPGPMTKGALAAALAGGAAAPSAANAPAIYAHPPPARGAIAPAAFAGPAPRLVAVNSNQDVQRALNQLGFRGANGLPLAVDGSIGPNSQFAVRKFQGQAGLTQDGVPGPITKAALAQALRARAVGTAA